MVKTCPRNESGASLLRRNAQRKPAHAALRAQPPSPRLQLLTGLDSLRRQHRYFAIMSLALFAAACACTPELPTRPPPNHGTYKVGQPYQIQGTWYYPKEDPSYDETGVASWYGPNFYEKMTANGEIYPAGDLTATQHTQPKPKKMRGTNLDNGRSIIVRVN